jgi:anti-sigma regulatory factor (Ser/Thr protein kinase)
MSKTTDQPQERAYSGSLTVPSYVESIRPAAQFIAQTARSLHIASAAEAVFEVAIVEALSNAFKHGNQGRRDTSIVCEMELIGRSFIVRVLDQGSGFVIAPPAPLPKPTAAEIDEIPASGRGIFVIQAVFPKVRTITRHGRFGLEMELTV